uniref:Glutathione S-transferase C-terminal domain-containing protein n=1 Tax=Rhizophagus irregularis (strain DAOM 181602 / DAOM 197198 / MUCL 43194) TaxID=747089 RepID=U9SWA0_RHIID
MILLRFEQIFGRKDYLVGDRFTLADSVLSLESIDEFTNLTAWIARIEARPAIRKGLNV